MPFKKYREHLIYKRLEKKVSTPPPSTSTSLQSVPLESGSASASKGINERIQAESPSSSARSSPTGPTLNGNLFNGSSSRLNSTRRPLSSLLLTDDEYNAYNYGLVPLSERNIYREFSVIELPTSSSSSQMPEKNSSSSSSMNTWSKKTSSLTSDYRHHLHHPHSHLTVPNGSHATSALKSPPSASSLYSGGTKAGSSSLEREKKTVRIVVEGEDGDNGSRKSPETQSRSGSASCKSNPFRSSFGRKGGAGARGEVLIPIRREFGSGSGGFPRSSSVSSTGSGKKHEHLRVASDDSGSAAMAMEPVPTPVRSYKCTSYTLNEIRSF